MFRHSWLRIVTNLEAEVNCAALKIAGTASFWYRSARSERPMYSHIRTLSSVRAGESARLVDIDAARELTARLAAMGLIRGVRVLVVKNGTQGPLIVSVHGGRLVLGRGMTDKIQVA